jgi:hypothetical protein
MAMPRANRQTGVVPPATTMFGRLAAGTSRYLTAVPTGGEFLVERFVLPAALDDLGFEIVARQRRRRF